LSWDEGGISPYAGAVWIYDIDELNPIGGLHISYAPFAALVMYSGTDTHLVASVSHGRHTLNAILFALELPGLGYGWRW